MNFKKWVKSIQTAGYNGARTVFWEGEISTLLLSVCTVDKSKVEIEQNFVAFSEYTNFKTILIGSEMVKIKEKRNLILKIQIFVRRKLLSFMLPSQITFSPISLILEK